MADTTQQATAPGLEIMAQRLFEMPYAELSPRLQIFIRRQVAKDAAEDMLEALKDMIAVAKDQDWAYALTGRQIVLKHAEDIVKKAEGKS